MRHVPSKVDTDTEHKNESKPSYYDLVNLKLEASVRVARAIQTLRSADVPGIEGSGSRTVCNVADTLTVAKKYWADICSGGIPVLNSTGNEDMRYDLPACVEAFRIIVMEHAQREVLEIECGKMLTHEEGFDVLTRPQTLYIEPKHKCSEACDHD